MARWPAFAFCLFVFPETIKIEGKLGPRLWKCFPGAYVCFGPGGRDLWRDSDEGSYSDTMGQWWETTVEIKLGGDLYYRQRCNFAACRLTAMGGQVLF